MGEHTKVKKASNKKFYWWERRWKRRIDMCIYIVYLYGGILQVHSVSASASEWMLEEQCIYVETKDWVKFIKCYLLHTVVSSMNFTCALDKFNLARHRYDTLCTILCDAEQTFTGTDTETHTIYTHKKTK